MAQRTRRTAIVLVVSMLVGLASALTTPVPAGAAPQGFELDMVEGELLIRDAEEPYALAQPTTIEGQVDDETGVVTAGSFTSPPISFETEALGQPVFVDATFSEVDPGSGTGSIDAEGNVSFSTALTVDLHIEVNNPPALVQECRTTPVEITLNSQAPHDPSTQRVTLSDLDFSIPAVPVTDTCISLVAENVNALLEGAGHSLTMTMEGELPEVLELTCSSTTTLEATPSSSFLGDDVTLTATVTPSAEPDCDVVPVGSVEFRAGTKVLDVVALDGAGQAVLVTDDIPAGAQQLVARYRGTTHISSSSAPVAHHVAVRPLAVIDAPSSVLIGGSAREVTVEVTNTGLGSEVINGRLDLTVEYTSPGPAPSDLTVEWFDGADWVPATVTPLGAQAVAAVMPAIGVPLPVGADLTQRVRLTAGAGVRPGLATLTFDLVVVDPGTGAPDPEPSPAAAAVATASAGTAFVSGSRVTSDPLVSAGPHTLRQGMSGSVSVSVPPAPDVPAPTGTYEVLLDGQVVPIRPGRTNPGAVGYQPTVAVPDTLIALAFVLPPDARTGTRELTVRYSGDPFYRPTLASTTITVLPARGRSYACVNQNPAFTEGFVVNVAGTALVPAAAKVGQPLVLDQLDIEVAFDRSLAYTGYTSLLPPEMPVVEPGMGLDGFEVVDFGFGDLGSGTATSVLVENAAIMDDSTRPVDPAPDTVMTFAGETAELTPAGAPGDVLDLDLQSLDLVLSFFGGAFLMNVSCAPVGDPVDLGDVVVAGTTLTVDAPDPTRVGDAVTLRATVAPAGTEGTVELRDGSTTLSVVPVASDGTASFTTEDLAVGSHSLTARFRSGSALTSSVSDAVPLEVIPAHDCPAVAVEGDSATIRLAYLVLVGRCPSTAGHDYWEGRLADGTSTAVLARSLARSIEGQGQLVDRAYEQVLGRAPDGPGRAYWAQQLRDGYRIDRLMASMAASPEFYAHAGGTPEGFVDLLYERILDRAPEPDGAAYWTGQLAAGVPRWRVARAFTGVAETRHQLTVVAYDVVLDREPSPSEATAGVALLAGGDLALLYQRLAGGAEFVDRAQDLPNP